MTQISNVSVVLLINSIDAAIGELVNVYYAVQPYCLQ